MTARHRLPPTTTPPVCRLSGWRGSDISTSCAIPYQQWNVRLVPNEERLGQNVIIHYSTAQFDWPYYCSMPPTHSTWFQPRLRKPILSLPWWEKLTKDWLGCALQLVGIVDLISWTSMWRHRGDVWHSQQAGGVGWMTGFRLKSRHHTTRVWDVKLVQIDTNGTLQSLTDDLLLRNIENDLYQVCFGLYSNDLSVIIHTIRAPLVAWERSSLPSHSCCRNCMIVIILQ